MGKDSDNEYGVIDIKDSGGGGTSRDYRVMHPYFESLKKSTDYYNGENFDLSNDVVPNFSAEINPHKVFHLMRYRGGIDGLANMDAPGTSSEDWREYGRQLSLEKYKDYTHTSFTQKDEIKKQPVNENVLLFPDSKSLEFELKNNYGRPISALLDKTINSTIGKVANDGLAVIAMAGTMGGSDVPGAGGAMDSLTAKIHNIAPDVAASQQFMLKYKNIPAWTGTDNLTIPSQLTFKFTFGQAGLFDAAEEVVRPIMSLAMYFAPSENGATVDGILPTEQYVKIAGAMAVGRSVSSAVREMAQGNGILSGVKAVYNTLNSEVAKIYNGNARGIMIARYGNILIPPFVVNSVKVKFDMAEVDENGYPYRGEITLSGIESFQMATQRLLKNMVSKQFAPKTSPGDGK